MKLAVVMCVHCEPDVARLALGSLVQQLMPQHDLDIHLGVHANWKDYCSDNSLFHDVDALGAKVHFVDEIAWTSPQWNSCWWRYSAMHAKNLFNVLRQVPPAFDRLLIVDHDVEIVGSLGRYIQAPNRDIVCALFEDRAQTYDVKIASGQTIVFAPKPATQFIVLGPNVVDDIVAGRCTIEPHMDANLDIFCDTMAKLGRSGYRTWAVKLAELTESIHHWGALSFNYGPWNNRPRYDEVLAQARARYKERFPKGWP